MKERLKSMYQPKRNGQVDASENERLGLAKFQNLELLNNKNDEICQEMAYDLIQNLKKRIFDNKCVSTNFSIRSMNLQKRSEIISSHRVSEFGSSRPSISKLHFEIPTIQQPEPTGSSFGAHG